MTLGMKIKKFRTMRGMTQKELGIKVGFSAATAVSRIGKYEKDLMAPKADIRKKLADALDVDLSALSDNNIDTYSDVMHTLFQFEEELGMTVERIDGKTHLVFDTMDKRHPILMSYLNSWYFQQQDVIEQLNNQSYDPEENSAYNSWKARFPMDIHSFWEDEKHKIDEFYDPIIDSISDSLKPIEKTNELILLIRRMLQNKLTIEVGVHSYRIGEGALVLSFLCSELLDDSLPKRNRCFAEFLYQLNALRAYGMDIDIDVLTNNRGTTIYYYLKLSPIMGLMDIIQKMISYESEIDTKEEWSKEMFERRFQAELKDRTFDLIKEIKWHYSREE